MGTNRLWGWGRDHMIRELALSVPPLSDSPQDNVLTNLANLMGPCKNSKPRASQSFQTLDPHARRVHPKLHQARSSSARELARPHRIV